MKLNAYKIPLIFYVCIFLFACENKTNQNNVKAKDEITPAANETANETQTEESESTTDNNNNCGSLKPLLLIFPAQKQINNAHEIFRGCQAQDYLVDLHYLTEGDDPDEFHYSAQVLNGSSPYVDSLVKMPHSTAEQQEYFRNAVTAIGTSFRQRFDLCKHYFVNPMIPDGRNPLIKISKGTEVCIMDNMDANREVWNVFATHQNKLGLTLVLEGRVARNLLTTERAAEYLVPLFELFNRDITLQ